MRTSRTLLLLLLTATFSFADSKKVSHDLDKVNPGQKVNVIVRYKHAPKGQQTDKAKANGGQLRRDLHFVNAMAYTVPAAALKTFDDDDDVTYVSQDRPLGETLDYANPAVNAAIARQYGWTGSGITVAVIDSGISTSHPDLSSGGSTRVVYSENFNTAEGKDTNDNWGHGTHVAGILGGNAASSNGPSFTHSFWGIAPSVKLVNLKVLDRTGQGEDSGVIAAIQRAIELKNTYNIRVINLSLGRPVMESYTMDPLCQAVEEAWKAGIVVVVAAGNQGRNNSAGTHGYGTISSPANDPYVITVGAMNDKHSNSRGDDVMASYSSKGPTLFDHIVKPDLVAPGNKIISAMPTGAGLPAAYPSNRVQNSYYMVSGGGQASPYYMELSGTSMATPMVAGAAALLLQKQPWLTPDQIKAKLMKTATKNFPTSSVSTDPATGAVYTISYDLFTVGAGYLDAWAALNNNDVITSPYLALSPSVVYSTTLHRVMIMTGSNIVWGDFTLGLNIVWGDQVLLANNIVWGDNTVWAMDGEPGFNIVWGDNVVWSDSATAGETTTSIGGDR